MALADELVWLIHQIRSTASPIERLKLLARGWRSVRALSADDRRSLARELGFDGAEQIIDQLARRGGMSPSNLLSVLHEAEQTDPATAMDEIRGLLDPGRRRDAAGGLLDTAADVLVGDGEQLPATSPSGLPATGEEAVVASPPIPGVGTSAPGAPAPSAATIAGAEAKQSPRAGGASLAGPDGGRTGAAGSWLSPGRLRRRLPSPEQREIQPPPPAATGAAQRGDARPGAAELTVGRRPDCGAELAAALSGETSLLRRLRRLSASAELVEGAGLAGLVAVLESFPAGWARRRALDRLLAAGVPRSTSDAIVLFELLPRPSERLWASTTLAASRPLDDGERAALLAAVPSPALRRRLARRLARR